MPAFEMTGTLKKKGDTVQLTESFVKRDFTMVVDENSPYPQVVQLQLTQNNCDKIDRIQEGEIITVKFNVKGKEYKDKVTGEPKVITNLDAWSILRPNETSGTPATTNVKMPPATPATPATPQEFINNNFNASNHGDDLPF